jgi:hypothetical protein
MVLPNCVLTEGCLSIKHLNNNKKMEEMQG